MGFLSAWAFTSSSWTRERIRQTAKKLLETSWILQNLLGNLSLLFPCWTLLNLFEQYKHVQIRFASRLPFLDHSTYPTSPLTPNSTDQLSAVLVRKLCHWPQVFSWPAWGWFPCPAEVMLFLVWDDQTFVVSEELGEHRSFLRGQRSQFISSRLGGLTSAGSGRSKWWSLNDFWMDKQISKVIQISPTDHCWSIQIIGDLGRSSSMDQELETYYEIYRNI